MAEKKGPTKTPFVDKVVKDPKAPPDALVLSGFLGTSSEAGHTRLYLDPQLSDCVEIPNEAILHSQEIPPEASPLGGSYVWIQRDAELIHPGPEGTSSKGTFLEGRIRKAYGGATDYTAGGPFPTLPTACGPRSICPPTCIPVVCQQECETKPDKPDIPTIPITQCGDGTVCPPTCIPILCDQVPEGQKPEQFPTFPLTRCGPGTACPPTCLPGLCGEQHPPCPTLIQTCATVPPFCGGGQAQLAMHHGGAAPAAGIGGAALATAVACPSALTACLPSRLVCPTRFFCPSYAFCPTLSGCPTEAICPSQFACPSQLACPSVLECGGFGQFGTPVAAARAMGAPGAFGGAAPAAGGIGGAAVFPTILACPSAAGPCLPSRLVCPTEFFCPSHAFCPTLSGCPTEAICPSQFACPSQIACPSVLECGGFGQFGAPVAARAVGGGGFGGFGGGGGIFADTAVGCPLPPDRTQFGYPTCDHACPTRLGCTRPLTFCGPASICNVCPTDVCPTRGCPTRDLIICEIGTVVNCVAAAAPLAAAQVAPQAHRVTAGSPLCEPTVLGLRSQCAPCASWIYPHCPVETLIGPRSQCPPTCVGPWCQAPTYDLRDCVVSAPHGCPSQLVCAATVQECGGFVQPGTPVFGGAQQFAAPAAAYARGAEFGATLCPPCPTGFGPRTACPPCPTGFGPRTVCPPTCLPPIC